MVPLRSLDVQEKALAAMKAAEPSMTAKLAPPCGKSGCTPYGTVKLASWLAGPLGDNYRSLVARTSEGVVILVPVTLSAGKDAAAAAAFTGSTAGPTSGSSSRPSASVLRGSSPQDLPCSDSCS